MLGGVRNPGMAGIIVVDDDGGPALGVHLGKVELLAGNVPPLVAEPNVRPGAEQIEIALLRSSDRDLEVDSQED